MASERHGGALFRDEAECGEGRLEVCALGGEDEVGYAWEPGGAAADTGAVEGEDEDLGVVDEGAEEFEGGSEGGEVLEFEGGGVGRGGGGGGWGEAGGFDVGAGAEEAAGAGEDGEDRGGVCVEVAEGGDGFGDELAAEIVENGGAVKLWWRVEDDG